MPTPVRPPPGRVTSTPERAPSRRAYDVVVLGAGLLGAVVADRLRSMAPDRSLLLVEADGLPNEDGATVASPGLLPAFEEGAVVPPADAREPAASASAMPAGASSGVRSGEAGAALAWARAWAQEALGDPGRATAGAGWLQLARGRRSADAVAGSAPLHALLAPEAARAIGALTGLSPDHPARLLEGGYLSAESLSEALARRAVGAGADLALNARARPHSATRIVLERTAVDRRMRLGVHARHVVEAGVVVVACGAAGARVAEEALDRPVRLAAAYLQFPRVRLRQPLPRGGLPVAALGGWAWRPAPGGAVLVAPPLPPDPEGYRPVPGRLLGVPVGLRRELVDRLLAARELEPLVASGRLDLGKSVRTVRGARFSVPAGGAPVAEPLGSGWWLLAGGTRGLDHDIAAAAGLAAEVAGAPPPWRG